MASIVKLKRKLCFWTKTATNVKIKESKDYILNQKNYFCKYIKIKRLKVQLNKITIKKIDFLCQFKSHQSFSKHLERGSQVVYVISSNNFEGCLCVEYFIDNGTIAKIRDNQKW